MFWNHYPRFVVKYVNAETGRVNTLRCSAYDQEALLAQLLEQGIEPTEIVEVPPDEASDKQLDYLSDLGVSAHRNLSKDEASDLIDNAIEHRQPSSAEGVELARHYQIPITRFTNKAAIYERICAKAFATDKTQLAIWFVFRVYRVEHDRTLAGIDQPDHPGLRAIAQEIVADTKLLKSLERAANLTATGFR